LMAAWCPAELASLLGTPLVPHHFLPVLLFKSSHLSKLRACYGLNMDNAPKVSCVDGLVPRSWEVMWTFKMQASCEVLRSLGMPSKWIVGPRPLSFSLLPGL
jgi:hypothetical protein